jgi:hypothetical protein
MKMYCMKCKKSFEAPTTAAVTKGATKMATAKHSCGTTCYKIVGRA